jgi:hypothetical protein
VLLPRGVLAPFWNRVAWDRADVRDVLIHVYERVAPELSCDGPMHPANLLTDADEDWAGGIEAVAGLGDAELRREPFLAAVAEAIEAHGEPVSIPMRTRLCLARRSA